MSSEELLQQVRAHVVQCRPGSRAPPAHSPPRKRNFPLSFPTTNAIFFRQSGIPFEESPSNPNEQNSNEQQSFSFGDYTLPCGNPPPVNNFGNGLWNQCYSWSDYTAYDYSYNSGSVKQVESVFYRFDSRELVPPDDATPAVQYGHRAVQCQPSPFGSERAERAERAEIAKQAEREERAELAERDKSSRKIILLVVYGRRREKIWF